MKYSYHIQSQLQAGHYDNNLPAKQQSGQALLRQDQHHIGNAPHRQGA